MADSYPGPNKAVAVGPDVYGRVLFYRCSRTDGDASVIPAHYCTMAYITITANADVANHLGRIAHISAFRHPWNPISESI